MWAVLHVSHMVIVHLFPQSLPDETFSSRVARYQLMTGNASSTATFKELFGKANFALDQIVPPHLETLAARLPGESGVTLHSFLRENTLLPLFRPFLGKREHGEEPNSLINRLPRRVVGKHGDAHLCIQCVVEADERFGFGYWHRSHQAPGVSACWKHGSLLLSSCPVCSLPFQRLGCLLEVPWRPCAHCGTALCREGTVHSAPANAVRYAVFVHDLLNANVAPVAPDLLAKIYRERIQQIGFKWGKPVDQATARSATKHIRSTSMTAFTEAFIEFFGAEFIAQVDPAYAAGRTTNWLRFSTVDGVMDMPVTRHILLAMRLFGTVAQFVEAIKTAGHETPQKRSAKDRVEPQVDVALRDQYRQRIAREIKIEPAIALQGLWHKAYRPTAWLVEHDKRWLDAALSKVPSEKAPREVTADELLRDKLFAEKVEVQARQWIAQSGKPQRITMQRLLDCIPLSYSQLKTHPQRFPMLAAKISVLKETSWSFSARRILWAVEEVRQLGLTLVPGNIRTRSSVSYYAHLKICEFARWDLDVMAHQPINISIELARAGIGLTWPGPRASAWREIGGRAYVATSSRPTNQQPSLPIYSEGIPAGSDELPETSKNLTQSEKPHARTTV
jgi:hypothetical protein